MSSLNLEEPFGGLAMMETVQLEHHFMGFALNACREGEKAQVVFEQFVSSEDGELFFLRLEQGVDPILKMLPNGYWLPRSQIDHVLIIFNQDKTANVYVDELKLHLEIRSRGKVAAGQGIDKDHIADIEMLDVGVEIPDDAGVLFLFSAGWRKGIYFDFAPLRGNVRKADLKWLFGQFYARLTFQDHFAIADVEWKAFFENKLFPFMGLSNQLRREMMHHIRAGWKLDDLVPKMVAEVKARASEFLEDWARHPTYQDHLPILTRAVERFLADDFISCTGLLFPRIEGLMRANHVASGSTTGFKQEYLALSAIGAKLTREVCILLPQRFHEYLENVYFASFAPRDSDIGVSRNSVGHGVARAESFDEKSAVIGLLVTHQLLFFFERGAPDPETLENQ